MPHQEKNKNLTIIELHPTFVAEIQGVDFSQDVSPEVFDEIYQAITKYGVLVFRNTALDDERHVRFARLFGELDDVTPYTKQGKKHRLQHNELFDVSNLLEDGSIAPLDSHRAAMNRGNTLFHVDSSFNPRRASYSLLRAHTLPPKHQGGATEFADTRTAFTSLSATEQSLLIKWNPIAFHSLLHSRRLASPEQLGYLNPHDQPMSKHRLVQVHEPSGKWNLYVAAHIHHLEPEPPAPQVELPSETSNLSAAQRLERLYAHACQDEFVCRVEWLNAGDLVVWDNTCVMHRATSGGGYEGKFVRDMRRATVHDSSSGAWGLNEKGRGERVGYP